LLLLDHGLAQVRPPNWACRLAAALAVLIAVAPGLTVAAIPSPADLPDWAGAWQNAGPPVNTDLFDGGTADPPGCRALSQPCRSHPPLTSAWEERYRANLALSLAGRLPPDSTNCMPRGVPANMRTQDSIEFVVRPEQVWIFIENTHVPRRIYTDGRPHHSGPDVFPTYNGDSIGRWEGDTLVVETINLKPNAMIDRSGIYLGSKTKITERIRKVNANTMEDVYSIEDPDALARPWVVTRQYRRVGHGRIFDYACAENVRNTVAADGSTTTLGPDGKSLD